MSDQKRLFTAAVLMMGVLLLSWFITGNKAAVPQDTVDTRQTVAPLALPEAETTETEEDVIPFEQHNAEQRDILVFIYDDQGEVMVEAGIVTSGGAITKWDLLKYMDLSSGDTAGETVDMANENWLLSMVSGAAVQFSYNGPDTVRVTEGDAQIVLESQYGSKTFTFSTNYYGFTLNDETAASGVTIQGGAIPVTEELEGQSGYFSASWYTNKHRKTDSEKIEAMEPVGNVSWIAVSNKYFTIVLMPLSSQRSLGFIDIGEGGSPSVTLEDSLLSVYAGPKSYHELNALGGSQVDMIDFGWPIIRWIGKLIFLFLTGVLSFVSNWGVRIIILAFVLKALMSPLTTKSYVSMQKMQKIQPAMQEIQKKHAKDPKQQQAEMQKLYKESGVNPLGGCLPMLLQMPVFFAMYRVLANMVELRGAGFLFWIKDLSRPEIIIPLGTKIMGIEGIGLLAILLGVMMFLQQKLTGSSSAGGAAAQQQKTMMYIMPFFMTFIFIRLASGLTLYWLVFNILTLGHQEIIKKRLEAEQANGNGK
jgi:YidC/Oxa1 family membrane protein insertase